MLTSKGGQNQEEDFTYVKISLESHFPGGNWSCFESCCTEQLRRSPSKRIRVSSPLPAFPPTSLKP